MRIKKTICCALCILLAASACGCGEIGGFELPPLPTFTPEVITDPLPEASEASASSQAEPLPETSGSSFNIVSIKHTELNAYDPQNGEELILSFSYDTPSVYIEGKDDISSAINEYVAMQAEGYYTGESYGDGYGEGYINMLTMAEDNYNYIVNSGAEGLPQEYVSDWRLSVERSDERVLTLVYDSYLYMGGAHGTSARRGYSFDLESGELLSLEDLADDYTALSSFLVDYMVNSAESDSELAARIDLLPEELGLADAFSALLRSGSWYLDNEGMVIFSDEYEISSYASGPIIFTVPYSELSAAADARWIPDTFTGTGSFEALSPEDISDGGTIIIDRLAVSEEGEELYLKANGEVYDVCVSTVEFSDGIIYHTGNLWHCSYMKDSALQIVSIMPEGMPLLWVTWRDSAGEHGGCITPNGRDGGYDVSEGEIEAVG